jgi:hypothetical protein
MKTPRRLRPAPSANLLSYTTPEDRSYELREIVLMGIIGIFRPLYHNGNQSQILFQNRTDPVQVFLLFL